MPDTHAIYQPTRSFPLPPICHADDPATMGDLADRIGDLMAAKAEIETEIDRLRGVFTASGQTVAEGSLFRIALGAPSMQSRIDRKAIERDMGDGWIAKYLKWSPRGGAFTCAARNGRGRP